MAKATEPTIRYALCRIDNLGPLDAENGPWWHAEVIAVRDILLASVGTEPKLTPKKCDEWVEQLDKHCVELIRGEDFPYDWPIQKVRRMIYAAGRRATKKIATRTTSDGIVFGLADDTDEKFWEIVKGLDGN